MTMKRCYGALSVGLLWLGLVATANAALISRLSGAAVYDTDLDITWLANANLAQTNTFSVSGINAGTGAMSWTTAQSWIDAMNVANYLGFNDWRRPVTLNPDLSCSQANATGSGCTGSEMGHLFYVELGGTAGRNITTSTDPDLALFSNIRAVYASGTEFTPSPTNAWEFAFNGGFQSAASKGTARFVWPVRSGDVTPIPEPGTLGMLIGGVLLLADLMRRRADRGR